jgi:hypothetical protein
VFQERFYKVLFIIAFITISAMVAAMPEDATGWFQQAQTSREAGELGEALEALERAEALGFASVRVKFERARIHTLKEQHDKAVAELQAIADTGFTAVGFIVNDDILKSLAGNSGFDTIVAEMAAKAYPCENDDSFRAFDFWVGEWDVHLADGTLAGTNSIEAAERGCMLIERWSSAGGGTGTSVNYLDKATGEWVQVWNAAGGSQIQIRGGMTSDGMLLVGTLHSVATGTTLPFRGLWTLLDDGRVRQFFEQSTDGGETWSPWFEGFYTRKE